ncbi:CHAT domain-containing protein [Streptomyces sp. NPDC054833]
MLIVIVLVVLLVAAAWLGWAARVVVPAGHVGIVTRRFGPSSRNPGFKEINPASRRGVLARTLLPGCHWMWPVVNSVDCVPRVHVPAGMVGVVTALEGHNRSGRGGLAAPVDCDDFQDGEKFLLGDGVRKGEQGLQVQTLSGGRSYYINPRLFRVEMRPRTYVPPGTIGLVQAKEGAVRPPDRRFGRHVECDNFQDGEAFLAGGGEQGRQLAILGGGAYYDINPELFEVITVDNVSASRDGLTEAHLREISIGDDCTGVVITLDGAEPGQDLDGAVAPRVPGHSSFRLPWVFLEQGGQRGVQEETLGKGTTCALNPWFVRVMVIPTRVLILKWHDKRKSEADNYDTDLGRITVNVEGFDLSADLSQNLRIPPHVAPRLVSGFGGVNTAGLGGPVDDPAPVKRFVRDVLGAVVAGYFNEIAMTNSVLEFLAGYEHIRKDLTDRVRHALEKWGVESLGTSLSRFISTDPDLPETLKTTFVEEGGEQELGVTVENAKLDDLVDAYRARAEARHAGLELKAEVEALGKDNVAMIRIVRELAGFDVPEYIGGGGDVSAYLQTLPLPAMQDLLARLRQLRTDQQINSSTLQPARAEVRDADDLSAARTPAGRSDHVSGYVQGDHVDVASVTFHGPVAGRKTGLAAQETDGPASEERRLVAELAEQAAPGREVPLHVQIVCEANGGVALRPFAIPAEGARLHITVHAPGLVALGDLQQELTVYPGRDSDVVRFGLRTAATGLHRITARAFRGGTFLGEVHCQISVEDDGPTRDGRTQTALLPSLAFEPGEVTLQVLEKDRKAGTFTFQLLSANCHPPEVFSFRAGDPRAAARQIFDELKRAAKAAADGDRSVDRARLRRRLRSHGVQLWTSAVPDAVQHQFWAEADRITAFTVLGEHDIVPWELLYPLNEGCEDKGFLAEWLPVVRRVFDQERVGRLSLPGAAFVVPPGSPADAHDEVDALRASFGIDVVDAGVLTEGEALRELIEGGYAGLLHFACHNTFSGAGSCVQMADGAFDPIDLAAAAQLRSLRPYSPLVFFNACRSAGEIDWFGSSLGWAPQFLQAGAGAFVGTLWPVRSQSALMFADAFYHQLIVAKEPLGQASLAARRAISDQDGDPSWLAYAVYGSPAATADTTTPGSTGVRT